MKFTKKKSFIYRSEFSNPQLFFLKKMFLRIILLFAIILAGMLLRTAVPESPVPHCVVASGSGSEALEPESVESAEPTPSPKAPSVKTGWHGKGKKRYYIMKNKKRAKGYKKIGKYYYFFSFKKGYALVSNWKTVTIHKKNYRLYFDKKGRRKMDPSGILDKKSGVSYRIEANLTTNSVMVYAKWKTNSYCIPVRRMRCSSGMSGHGTITGTYRPSRTGSRWHVLRYGCYGQYCSRIRGPYLFHSVVYKRYGDRSSLDLAEYNKLGKSASHGCIRLQVADALWIYNHAGSCIAHIYYGKKEKLPLPYPAKKTAIKKPGGKYSDPTDRN